LPVEALLPRLYCKKNICVEDIYVFMIVICSGRFSEQVRMGKPRKGKSGKAEGWGRGEDKRQEHTRQEDSSEMMNSLTLSSHDEEVPFFS
jgi:hypothetical protein